VVPPDSVYRAVAALRRALGDDAKEPTYIANVMHRGYRLVAPISCCVSPTIFGVADGNTLSALDPVPTDLIAEIPEAGQWESCGGYRPLQGFRACLPGSTASMSGKRRFQANLSLNCVLNRMLIGRRHDQKVGYTTHK
jgi:hypothetical protein